MCGTRVDMRMLLWAILLQTVPLKPGDERVDAALPRLLDLVEQSEAAPTRRYRLGVASVEDASLRGEWKPFDA
jgi:hypothetical protein